MGNKIKRAFIISLGFFLYIPLATHADVYRWVDEEGGVHFSDKPKSHPSAEKIEIKTDTVRPDPNQQKRLKYQQHLLSVIEEERNIKQKKLAEKKKKKEERKKSCKKARKTLDEYLTSGQLYGIDKKGNKFYLSDDEREQEIKKAKEVVKYWCK